MHVALVVTGAPLANRAHDLISALDDDGHRVSVCISEAGQNWTRIDDRWRPSGRIRPDALVVAPGTFNTLNKWTAGINDTEILGLLNDSLGLGIPILVVPMVADRLAAHPTWPKTLATLTAANVILLDPVTGESSSSPAAIVSGTGDQVAADFQPAWIGAWLQLLDR